MKNKIAYFLLIFIVVFSVGIRFYKIGEYPKGFTWDEAAVGYNSYTIINWGKDEYGKILPLTFKSFGDDKNPVHFYLTAPFVGIFGLNETSTRVPAALFGVLNVIAIFLLARKIFKNNSIGLISALFMSISPFAIQFSRFNHELNFAIFFFLLGTYLFYKGIEDKRYLILSFIFFGIDLLTYQSAKVVTFTLVMLLILLNFKKLIIYKKQFVIGIFIYAFFVSLQFMKPELLGTARFKQNQIDQKEIENTIIYKKTGDNLYGIIEVIAKRYIKYFDLKFLFISGDQIPRHSIQSVGTFYWMDLPLIVLGLAILIYSLIAKKNRQMIFILAWLALAPIPGAVSSTFSHAPRAMFMLGSWTIITALGANTLIKVFSNKKYQIAAATAIVLAAGYFVYKYVSDYFGKYSSEYAIEWIYGMKEAVASASDDEYKFVYMTDAYMQPYIFFLFYSKTPLPEYLKTVKFNHSQSAPSSLVDSFGKYNFRWDQYHSVPFNDTLYIIRPSIYDGLYEKNNFKVVKIIKFPNGTDDLYLIKPKYE